MQGNKKCKWQMILFFKVCVPLFFVKLLLWFEHNTSYSQKQTFYSRTYKRYHKQQKGQRCPGYVITLKVLRQGDGPRSRGQGLNTYLSQKGEQGRLDSHTRKVQWSPKGSYSCSHKPRTHNQHKRQLYPRDTWLHTETVTETWVSIATKE